jgi:hypothetical protein
MKLGLMFIAVSLILVVGIVAIAFSSPAQAAKRLDQGQWCYTSAGLGAVCGFDSMVNCKQSAMAQALLFHTVVKLEYLNCYKP